MDNYKNFNHIKIHTQYSICEGALKINELAEFCKKNKVKSAGLSDTSNLCGALEFSENLSKSGTQPIIGTQINFKFKDIIGLLPLIATSEKGYRNIIEFSSNSYMKNNDKDEPHCNFNDVLSTVNDIIILSGTINGLIGKLFVKGRIEEIEEIYSNLKKKFKNNFYIEIQRHNDFNEKNLDNYNINISNEIDIPIIASHYFYYLE